MKRRVCRRRLLQTVAGGATVAATASAGCMGLLGGNRSHGDASTYRQFTANTEWNFLQLASRDGMMFHESATGRVGRVDDSLPALKERETVLLESDHVSTITWSHYGVAPTNASAETVASYLVDEGGSRLDVDMDDEYVAVHRKHLYVVGPDAVTFGAFHAESSVEQMQYFAKAIAEQMAERPDSYEASETWEERLVALTDDLGIPDAGNYLALPADVANVPDGLAGWSRAYYFDDDGASVTISGLFEAESDADASVLRTYLGEREDETFARMDSPDASTDGRFARLDGRLAYQDETE